MVDDARRQQRAGEEPIRLPDLDIARGRFEEARDYLEGSAIEQPVVNKELEGWPRINLAEIAVWDGHPDVARALVDEGLGIVANQDESLATAYLCAVGIRAEADRADESRIRQRHDERDDAIRVGTGLLEVARDVLARPGPSDGWKREVGALVTQSEAEATRVSGGSEVPALDPGGGCVGGALHAVRRRVLPVAVCRGDARRGDPGHRGRTEPHRGIRHRRDPRCRSLDGGDTPSRPAREDRSRV